MRVLTWGRGARVIFEGFALERVDVAEEAPVDLAAAIRSFLA